MFSANQAMCCLDVCCRLRGMSCSVVMHQRYCAPHSVTGTGTVGSRATSTLMTLSGEQQTTLAALNDWLQGSYCVWQLVTDLPVTRLQSCFSSSGSSRRWRTQPPYCCLWHNVQLFAQAQIAGATAILWSAEHDMLPLFPQVC